MGFTTVGGSFTLFTVTLNISLTLRFGSPSSVAVRLMSEEPLLTSVMVSIDPEIETVTTPVLLLMAEYVRLSPSGSLNTFEISMVCVAKSLSRSMSGIGF